MKKVIKNIVKYLGIAIGAVLLLALLAVWSVGSGVFNKQIVKIVNAKSGNFINGNLTVEKLSGNLFKGLKLKNVLVVQQGDTILFAGELDLGYSLRPLLKKQIKVSRASISDVRLQLEQNKDSVWNFVRLLPAGNPADTVSSAPFSWEIDVKQIAFNNLSATILPVDTASLIPRSAKASLKGDFAMKEDDIKLGISSFELQTLKPDLQVNSLTIDAGLKGNVLDLSQLALSLQRTQLNAQGIVDLSKPEALTINIDIPVLSFDDFRYFLADIPLYGEPEVKIAAENNQYDVTIDLEQQHIRLSAWISQLDSAAAYRLAAALEGIDVSQWTRDNSMKSLITGDINLDGKGLNLEKASGNFDINLRQLSFAGYSAAVDLQGAKNSAAVDGNLKVNSQYGRLNSNFNVDKIFSIPEYRLTAQANQVDISKFTGDSLFVSDINIRLSATGRDYHPDKLRLTLDLKADPSMFAGFQIDTMAVKGTYNAGNYNVSEAALKTPWADLDVAGQGKITGNQNLEYSLRIDSLNTLAKLVKADTLNLNGLVTGTFSGDINHFQTAPQISLNNIIYNNYAVGSVMVNGDISREKDNFGGHINADISAIDLDSLLIDSILLKTNLQNLTLENQLEIVLDSLTKADAKIDAVLKENPEIVIPDLNLVYKNLHWQGQTDTITIHTAQFAINADLIRLYSDNQSITASGYFSMSDSLDVNFDIDNLDIAKLPVEEFTGIAAKGIINSSATMKGPVSEPVIDGRLWVDNFRVDTLAIDSVRTQLTYADSLLSLKGLIAGYGIHLMDLSADVPFRLSLADSISLLSNDQRLNILASSDIKSLEPLSHFFPKKLDLDGVFDMRLDIKNSIQNPDINGFVRLHNGKIIYPDFGINYSNAVIDAQFEETKFVMDSLWIQSGNGWLHAQGFLNFNSLDSIYINEYDLSLKGSNFSVIDGPQGEVIFDSDVTMKGNMNRGDFGGNIKIEKGLLNVDVLASQFGMVSNSSKVPLLQEALERGHAVKIDSVKTIEFSQIDRSNLFYRNLRGEMAIEIPGNFWVRGKDMNFELEGNLKAIKEDLQIDIFGNLDIKRGQYTLYGKKLVFETGQITFTGGSKIDPTLNFTVSHSFRDADKQLRKLTAEVTGKISEPQIGFKLDDAAIEERDGISYLLFNKSLDELTQNEFSSVNGTVANIGKNLAFGQISNLLQEAFQSSLGLDVIEIEGSDSWNSGNVTIGKYLTQNLYMSYSKEFSLEKNNNTAQAGKITLEYQIFKWLFLQATSQTSNPGFDLIFQKKWK